MLNSIIEYFKSLPQRYQDYRLKHQHHQQLAAYWQAIPLILKYQILTKTILVFGILAFEWLFGLLIASAGRVAISSGDFLFIFSSWQGIILIATGVAFILMYVVLDLFAKIIFSDQLLKGQVLSWRHFIVQLVKTSRHFLDWRGAIVIFYVLLIAPLVGLSLSVSLTKELYVPHFISSVIDDNPVWRISYLVLELALMIIGLMHVFVFHGVLIDHLTVKQALAKSRRLMKKNWRLYIWENIKFTLKCAVPYLIIGLVFFPIIILIVLADTDTMRTFLMFWCFFGRLILTLLHLLFVPFYIMKLTQLYHRFSTKQQLYYRPKQKRRHFFMWVIAIGILEFSGLQAWIFDLNFEKAFPQQLSTGIVAHRGGGQLAVENTIAGMQAAIALDDVTGSEFDVQRTSDGAYIINHDTTFKRLANDKRRPSQMTLAEVQSLRLHDTFYPDGEGERVATLEEMLDTAKDKITPFIELKGETADKQMADDVVKMLEDKQMLDQAVIISLSYDLIDYIETHWPQVTTGYILSVSIGDTSKLATDYLIVEEETASNETIAAIHEQGKKVIVWTVNNSSEQEKFLQTKADLILTDRVTQAIDIKNDLESRSDVEQIIDRILDDSYMSMMTETEFTIDLHYDLDKFQQNQNTSDDNQGYGNDGYDQI